MVCKKCSKMIVCNAFSNTNCDKCSTKIVTGHMPGYKVCKGCSEKHNICQQCGDTISEN